MLKIAAAATAAAAAAAKLLKQWGPPAHHCQSAVAKLRIPLLRLQSMIVGELALREKGCSKCSSITVLGFQRVQVPLAE